MNYTAYAKQQIEKGNCKAISKNLITWEEENQEVIGKLLSIEEFTETQFQSTCQKYLFDTDEGEVSLVLGAANDTILNLPDNVGKIFSITFKGKVQTKNKNMVNKFVIIRIDEETKNAKK